MDRYTNADIVFSKFSRNYMELKKDLPIRPSEIGVLNIITNKEELYTPVMIAELLGVSKPMIATHISVLEENGYIYKELSASDKRSFYIMPTEKAKKLVDESTKKNNENLKKIENELRKEKFDLLIDLVNEAREVLEQDRKIE